MEDVDGLVPERIDGDLGSGEVVVLEGFRIRRLKDVLMMVEVEKKRGE